MFGFLCNMLHCFVLSDGDQGTTIDTLDSSQSLAAALPHHKDAVRLLAAVSTSLMTSSNLCALLSPIYIRSIS